MAIGFCIIYEKPGIVLKIWRETVETIFTNSVGK